MFEGGAHRVKGETDEQRRRRSRQSKQCSRKSKQNLSPCLTRDGAEQVEMAGVKNSLKI